MMARSARSGRTHPVRWMVLVFASMFSLATLLAGCGVTAHATSDNRVGATATPTTALPTPTATVSLATLQASGPPVSGTAAVWRHANLPADFGMAFHQSDLDTAVSDGLTAYSCAVPGGAAHPEVIVTHDRGASWTRVADIPATWYDCLSLRVDRLDPNVAVVDDGVGPDGITVTDFMTIDGGTTWQRITTTQPYSVVWTATLGSRTYAVLNKNDGHSFSDMLVYSDDHLQTWHAISANLNSSNFRGFWVNPTTGALLVETWPDGTSLQLWTSHDDGQHWTRLAYPVPGIVEYTVQQPTSDQLWHVCGGYYASTDASTESFVCTTDGGQSWTIQPALMPAGTGYVGVAGIAADGALLVVLQQAEGEGFTLYRLPPGATRWQDLGTLPPSRGTARYVPSASGGVLWLLPAESDGAGAPDPADAVYTAAYPK